MFETPFHQINGIAKSDLRLRYMTQINTPTSYLKGTPLKTDTNYYKRYKGLDLAYYKNAMTPQDFDTFLSFVGAESLDISEGDFDVYYSEE